MFMARSRSTQFWWFCMIPDVEGPKAPVHDQDQFRPHFLRALSREAAAIQAENGASECAAHATLTSPFGSLRERWTTVPDGAAKNRRRPAIFCSRSFIALRRS